MPDNKLKDNGETRPPVVAILGHIDHGKSTLIDYIRKTNVTGTEAGGITQHVSAYEIIHAHKDGKRSRITFLDTPGHEAFSSIRNRSANVADIAVLVVSAEDGVKTQTLEVLKHIKESSLPFLVVISKIDKPSADVARTKQNLAENNIYVEGFGGDIPAVELSATTGKGVEEFLDMIILMTELEAKTGDREALGSGVIIESKLDPKRGITAVGIIKDGTVRKGLFAATKAGQDSSSGAIAPIRFLLDAEGNMAEELSFSSPVQIIGWDKMPAIGSEFQTFLKKDDALTFIKKEKEETNQKGKESETVEDMTYLPLVIKADASGSLEAVTEELKKLSRERIVPKIILSSVGKINENDVKSAQSTPGTIILGFNTQVDSQAALLAERSETKILSFKIIYELTDKVKEFLAEKEPKIEVEEIASSSKILKLFGITKNKQVVGGRVLTGTLKRGAMIRIIRRETEIGRGKIKELQKAKLAIDTAEEGTEFGTMIESKVELAPGDILNAVILVTK
jgi:translation initiation factor IF-2